MSLQGEIKLLILSLKKVRYNWKWFFKHGISDETQKLENFTSIGIIDYPSKFRTVKIHLVSNRSHGSSSTRLLSVGNHTQPIRFFHFTWLVASFKNRTSLGSNYYHTSDFTYNPALVPKAFENTCQKCSRIDRHCSSLPLQKNDFTSTS